MTKNPKEILNIDEACDLLSVSAKTLAKILRETDIPGRKIGREWKFSRRALIEWVGNARARDFLDEGKKRGRKPKQKKGEGMPESKPQLRPPAAGGVDRFSIEED